MTALTGSTGVELADLLKADEDLRKLLLRQFSKRPPAFPVAARKDYPDLLRKLSQRLDATGEPSLRPYES